MRVKENIGRSKKPDESLERTLNHAQTRGEINAGIVRANEQRPTLSQVRVAPMQVQQRYC